MDRIRDPQDSEAWKDFIELYKNYIYFIIRSMNIKPQAADDILQQVSLKLWKNLQLKRGAMFGTFESTKRYAVPITSCNIKNTKE